MTKADLAEGKVSLACGSTAHKTQDATVDRAFYIHNARNQPPPATRAPRGVRGHPSG